MSEKTAHLNVFFQQTDWLAVLRYAAPVWLQAIAILFLFGFAFSLLLGMAWAPNPAKGFKSTFVSLWEGIRDLLTLPFGWRRIGAIATLTFREAIRRRILYVFVLFFLPFLFAAWYLPNTQEGQLLFLVAFVNTAMTFILLPLVVFLVSMNLPDDIRLRTIQTVVTKPIRRLELIVGRITGFMLIFTAVLVVMGAASLVYLRGQIFSGQPTGIVEAVDGRESVVVTSPDHRLKAGTRIHLTGMNGTPSLNTITSIIPIDANRFQLHDVTATGDYTGGGQWKALPDSWTARVPILASSPGVANVTDKQGNQYSLPLVFEKNGQRQATGTNVGKELNYRSHIEGQTRDSAHWFFQFDPSRFAGQEFVRVELRFDVFKTTKGDPTREGAKDSGVWCLLTFLDRETGQNVYDVTFRVDNHRRMSFDRVPAEVVKSGKVEVVAQCLTRSQFIGMAPGDLYFLAAEKPFELNFLKGLTSLWLKLLLITCISVAASTVLNGFVTVLLTIAVYILGFYYNFLVQVIRGDVGGGGPIESLIRIVTQDNQTTELERNLFINIVLAIDRVALEFMNLIARLIPDLSRIDTIQLVADGFDVPWSLVGHNVLIVFGYIVPVVITGYFLLKNRELAA